MTLFSHPARPRASAAVLLASLVVAACLAAALAHGAIDALGDIVLAHDAYDDLVHDTRSAFAALAIAGALGGAIALVLGALQRRDGGAQLHATLRGAIPRHTTLALAAVVALALPMLVSIEALDCSLARQSTDLDALFGGSIALGLGVTTLVALALGSAMVGILRFLGGARLAVLRLVAALARLLRARDRADALHRARRIAVAKNERYTRSSDDRGPPILHHA